MNDEVKRKEEPMVDNWISNWEQQCIDEIESGPDLEQNILNEQNLDNQKLWLLFQNAATNISQLYKDKQQGLTPHWVVFQNAAGATTCLYKQSLEAQKKMLELGVHHGYQRRNKDLISWAKKRRRHIRREELIAYLCGKNPPIPGFNTRSSPRPRNGSGMDNSLRNIALQQRYDVQDEPDLRTFREAMALSSLNGAMSSISVGLHRPHGSNSPTQTGRHHRRSGSGSSSPPTTAGGGNTPTAHLAELNAFICEEFTRHLKRPAASDMRIDSPPSQKRSRFM